MTHTNQGDYCQIKGCYCQTTTNFEPGTNNFDCACHFTQLFFEGQTSSLQCNYLLTVDPIVLLTLAFGIQTKTLFLVG